MTVHDKDRDVEPVEEDSSEEDGKAIEGSLKYIEIVVGIVLAIILIIALIEGLSN